MEEDYKTTTTRMVTPPENKHYNILRTTVIRASKALGWTFHTAVGTANYKSTVHDSIVHN